MRCRDKSREKLEKMYNDRSISLASLLVLALISCFFLSGCGRSMARTAVQKSVPQAKATADSPVDTTRQDLSMAEELKKQPVSEYILGPEDKVEITVFGHDELKTEATVSPSGKIACYLAGDIQAAGLTRFQLRDRIKKGLAEFIRYPEVIVRIVEYRSHKIFILGQFSNPGVLRMRNDFTLLEAISSAGGITPDAYLEGAYVVRDGKILLVNFVELVEKGNTEENVPLAPNDVVYIPDSRDQKVFVLGEVNQQAAIPMRDTMTLLEAVAEAGGFTRDAKKGAVVVIRGNLSEPEIMKVDVSEMDLAANMTLRRGDIVYVASSTFASVERAALRISHILQPFLQLARTVVWGKAAANVLEGGNPSSVVVD